MDTSLGWRNPLHIRPKDNAQIKEINNDRKFPRVQDAKNRNGSSNDSPPSRTSRFG